MSHPTASTTPETQAPQSLGLDVRRVAMLKAMGVNWRWPAPKQEASAAVASTPETQTPVAPPEPMATSVPARTLPPHPNAAEAPPTTPKATPSATPAAPAAPAVTRSTAAPRTTLALDGLNWSGLRETASACQACGLATGRVGHSWGQGHERAKWLFITPRLNPSDDGDATVQGDELALLQSLWQAMGVTETDVFVTSLTKCRAGLGLHASAEDTAQCLAYLQHQVRWLQPDMIVALGLPVAHALLGASDAPLAQWRDRIHEWQGTPTLVTYPLDVLLRRPVDKAKWWADLCLGLDHLTANETP